MNWLKKKMTEKMKVLFSFWEQEAVLPSWRGPERSQQGEDVAVAGDCPNLSASMVDSGAEWDEQAEAAVDLSIAFY